MLMGSPFRCFSLLLAVVGSSIAFSFDAPPARLNLARGSGLQTPSRSSRVARTRHSPEFTHRGQGTACKSSSLSNDPTEEVDFSAIVKYGSAIVLQVSLIGGLLFGLDLLVSHFAVTVPFAVNIPLFYAMALKSRVFNPLSNERPKPQTLEAGNDEVVRKMPSWTPPGVIFPIMWLLIIGPIRAVSASLIYASTGHYACLPLLAFILHLSVGDVWNTINNVERRYGVAVAGVLCVWLSNAHAAYQYWGTDPLAGKLLGGVSIWLTIAASLVAATWRINPDPDTGMPEPLYPVKGKATTKFTWFE